MRKLTDTQIELMAACETAVEKCRALAGKLRRNKMVVLASALENCASNLKASFGLQARVLREDDSLLFPATEDVNRDPHNPA